MNGSRVLQVMALVLLSLGAIGVAFQLFRDGPTVMWLGAVGPIMMGIALLIISTVLRREG